ncbi:MAG: hypothetical protein VYD64_00215 [Pseudomonadota bacterium]|nr:hypothetical protein [Pseudomonadota bacterium]
MITDEGQRVTGSATRPGADEPTGGKKPAEAVAGSELNETFLDTIFSAAHQAGCELLFEVPGALFSDPGGRSAAMRCGSRQDAELFFILFNAADGAIRVLEESDVPESVLDFTRSYAGVLGLIAGDRRLTAPLLQ